MLKIGVATILTGVFVSLGCGITVIGIDVFTGHLPSPRGVGGQVFVVGLAIAFIGLVITALGLFAETVKR